MYLTGVVRSAVAVDAERPRRGLGVIVAGREGTQGTNPAEAEGGDRRFGSTRDHDVRLPVFNAPEREADRMLRGSAGRGDREIDALDRESNGDLSAGGVEHELGYEERTDPPRPPVEIEMMGGLDLDETTDPGGPDTAGPRDIFLFEIETAVRHGLIGRSQGVGFQFQIFFSNFEIEKVLAYTFSFIAVVMLIETFIMRPMDRKATRWRM